jgi:hypothetical protein
MARPVTLFTGQWADLPLEHMARKTNEFGYDGIELACWGDHFEVDKALKDDGYCARKRELLEKHDLQCHAISAHLVGQEVSEMVDVQIKGRFWPRSRRSVGSDKPCPRGRSSHPGQNHGFEPALNQLDNPSANSSHSEQEAEVCDVRNVDDREKVDRNSLPKHQRVTSPEFLEETPSIRVIISYSHKDGCWLERLLRMLAPAIRRKCIEVWSDKDIRAGQYWRHQIDQALEWANVAVLMVSPNYLESEFVMNRELPYLLDAANERGIAIRWLLLSAALYGHTPLEEIHAAHDISRALDSYKTPTLNRVLTGICQNIIEAAEMPRLDGQELSEP